MPFQKTICDALHGTPKGINIALTCLALMAAMPAHGQASCDKCPKPKVAIYDFSVNISRPEPGDGRLADWYDLFFVSDRAGSELHKDQMCVDFLNGGLLTVASTGEPFLVGIEHTYVPPPGSMANTDYLFSGSIDGQGSGYQLAMSLETGCERRIALSASAAFDTPAKGSSLAKELARERFRPLLSSIREFERKVRDSDPKYAIYARDSENFQMTPAKRKAKPFEAIPVTFTLIDCDGAPLPNRVITLAPGDNTPVRASYNGTFEEPIVTTNGAGKATINFNVGGKRGFAIARAKFFYKNASGCEKYNYEETVIDVEGTAALYEVRFDYEQRQQVSWDISEPLDGGSKTARHRELNELDMSCVGVWENSADAQREGIIELSGAPIDGCFVTGAYRGTEMERGQTYVSQESAGPGLSSSSGLNTGLQDRQTLGNPINTDAEPVDLYFWYKGGDELDSSQFNIDVPFEMQSRVIYRGLERITGGGRVLDTPFSDSQSDTSQTSFSGSVTDSTYKEERASIVVSGTYESTETELGTTTYFAKIRAVITPIKDLENSAR